MPLNSSSADMSASAGGARTSRRGSELARDLLSASGTGGNKIADSEGHTFDPIGSTQGARESFLKQVGDNVREKVGSVIGDKALDPEAKAELQAKNPEAVAALSSTTGVVLEMAVFLTYVGLDMGKSLYNGYVIRGAFSHGHTMVFSALLITQGFIQFSMAMACIGYFEGAEGFKMLANAERYRKFFIVSALFALAQNFATAYTELSPGTIKILGQCRLLETAVLSKIIFNRRYIETQWLLMGIIIFGAVLHLMAKSNAHENYDQQEDLSAEQLQRTLCHRALGSLMNSNITNGTLHPMPQSCVVAPPEHGGGEESSFGMFLGIFYTFLYMMCSDIASIVSEMYLKSEKKTPFYIQKATMESMGIPVLLLTSFIGPWFQMRVGTGQSRWAPQMWWASDGSNFMGSQAAIDWCYDPGRQHHHRVVGPFPGGCGLAAGGLWRDWNNLAPWGALFFGSAQSWGAGFLVKLLSSVVKLLAKIVSLGGVFFLGDCWILYEGDEGNLQPAGVAAVQVILLTYTFLTLQLPKEEEVAAPKGEAEMSQRPAERPVVV